MHHPEPHPLSDLGWDTDFAVAFADYEPATPGRVARNDGSGIHTVETAHGPERVRLTPRFRRVGPTERPTVGDWVVVGDERLDGDRVIDAVLPRRSAIIRQAPQDRSEDAQLLAANVDTCLVIAAADAGVNQRRLDRYLALAWQSGTVPVIVLSKADRCDDLASVTAEVEAAALGTDVRAVSAVTGEGLDALDPYLAPGRTAVLLGPSGAGKSTLANRLLGAEVLATGEIRDDGRGRHTTTHRQLLRLPSGGMLIDTPGLRELGLWEADDGLAETFSDVEELAASCRFADCRHESEPGCAVRDAVESGLLPAARFESYQKLQRELAHQARKADVRLRQAEKGRWKQIHKEMRSHPKLRERD